MTDEQRRALQRAKRLYLTTYNPRGRSGTVPIWFFLHQDALYFCTRRESLKVRRIQQTGRATIRIGRRNGPRIDCRAELLSDDTELQDLLLRTYRWRYRWTWCFIGPRLRRAFARGEEAIVRLTPLSVPTAL